MAMFRAWLRAVDSVTSRGDVVPVASYALPSFARRQWMQYAVAPRSQFGRLISWKRFAFDVTDVTGFLLRDLVVLHGTRALPGPKFPGPTHFRTPLPVQCMMPPYRRRAGQESPSVWRGRQRRFPVVYTRRRGGQFSRRHWRRLVVRMLKAGGLSHDCRTLLCKFVTPCAELLW